MIVLVAGLPGSGKSILAEHLAKKLDAVYINSDQVRSSTHAKGMYSPKDRILIYKELLLQTTIAVEANRDVVVDATFYHHSLREMFIRLAEAFHAKFRLIELTADEELIRQRLRKRRAFSEADFSVYEIVRDDFEPITMPHLILESTNDNLEEMISAAITYINDES